MSKNELINAINTSKPTKNNKKIFLNQKEKRSKRVHETLKKQDP